MFQEVSALCCIGTREYWDHTVEGALDRNASEFCCVDEELRHAEEHENRGASLGSLGMLQARKVFSYPAALLSVALGKL